MTSPIPSGERPLPLKGSFLTLLAFGPFKMTHLSLVTEIIFPFQVVTAAVSQPEQVVTTQNENH